MLRLVVSCEKSFFVSLFEFFEVFSNSYLYHLNSIDLELKPFWLKLVTHSREGDGGRVGAVS